jgi:hypothetical protein
MTITIPPRKQLDLSQTCLYQPGHIYLFRLPQFPAYIGTVEAVVDDAVLLDWWISYQAETELGHALGQGIDPDRPEKDEGEEESGYKLILPKHAIRSAMWMPHLP